MSGKTYRCEKCEHEGVMVKRIKRKKGENKEEEEKPTPQEGPSPLPVVVTVKHRGFWVTNKEGKHEPSLDVTCDRNSVMLTPTCLLYVYKLALRHFLLSKDVIGPHEIDPANLVPHIVVRKNKNDPFSKYTQIENETFVIEESQLSAKSDFLIVELDAKRDLHCTLIFSRKISRRINLIDAFKAVIQILNKYPDMIDAYSNLPMFGQEAIAYWVDTKSEYPRNVVPPPDYKPPAPKPPAKIDWKLSAAGSVLSK